MRGGLIEAEAVIDRATSLRREEKPASFAGAFRRMHGGIQIRYEFIRRKAPVGFSALRGLRGLEIGCFD